MGTVITGPAALSYHDVAAVLSPVAGRPVKYVPVPPEAARQGMTQAGMPEWLADAFIGLNAAIKAGGLDFVTPDVKNVTGHEPRPLEAWFKENAGAFK